ncbi:MAG TPA: ATP-binding protein [Gemmatimonadaceae bacterium]|nr:ATP-binding protein [Gemmatimonadaceae bacterium]
MPSLGRRLLRGLPSLDGIPLHYRRPTFAWLLWIAITVAATLAMFSVRGHIDQAHVVLLYLLIVLGASASSGRALGFTLAFVAFILIDYFFQQPYDDFFNDKPLDLLVLIAFLTTAIVSTQLLARARAEAVEARNRATEVTSLSRLASETLNAGRAEEALVRIVEVIQGTLGVSGCSIWPWAPDRGFGECITREGIEVRRRDPDPLVQRAAERGEPLTLSVDGVLGGQSSGRPAPGTRELFLPLGVQTRVVGVLVLSDDQPIVFDPPKQRFLAALTYYAALGIERARLVREAEHAAALREADKMKDNLLASVSHDLRTPLTTIKALAQTAALRGDTAAAAIEEQADRLTRLVADLLDLSRMKGDAFRASPDINTAEDLIGAAQRQAQGLLADGRSIHAVVDLESPALVGRFDFTHALRIIGNLLENALRYTAPGGSVELGVRRDGDSLVFTVADRGPGIPIAESDRIFQAFYRHGDAAPDVGRAGLGLSIARRLAEIQQGSLEYEPRVGGGSVFVLRLPAVDLEEA